jgi:hypothetical protein
MTAQSGPVLSSIERHGITQIFMRISDTTAVEADILGVLRELFYFVEQLFTCQHAEMARMVACTDIFFHLSLFMVNCLRLLEAKENLFAILYKDIVSLPGVLLRCKDQRIVLIQLASQKFQLFLGQEFFDNKVFTKAFLLSALVIEKSIYLKA